MQNLRSSGDGSVTAVLQVLAAAVLFGTTGTAQALGPDHATALGVGAARLIAGGAVLLAALPLLGGQPRQSLRLWRLRLGLTAGVCTALYQVCFFAAVQQAGVAVGTLVTIGSGPVFAGLLARVLLGERLVPSWLVATGLCVSGLALLSAEGFGGGDVAALGPLLALGAGLSYATYTVAARQLIMQGESSATVMASAFSLGGLLLIPLLFTQPLGWIFTPSGSALVAYLGLMTTALAYVLFGRGLTVLPAGPVTTLVLAEPLVATLLAVSILGERLQPLGVLGAAIVLAGLTLQGHATSREAAA